MRTSTKEAWTDEQITVLEFSEEYPGKTPSELAEIIQDEGHNDEVFTTDYVVSILDGFHLPFEVDNPECESSKRMEGDTDDGGVIELSEEDIFGDLNTSYRCSLCGEESPNSGTVRGHISKSKGSHKGRSGSEVHLVVPQGDNAKVLRRLTCYRDEVIGNKHLKVMWYVYHNPETTMGGVVDKVDCTRTSVGRYFEEAVGKEWGHRTEGRKEDIEYILDAMAIKFVKGEDEESEPEEAVTREVVTEEMEDTLPEPIDLPWGSTKDDTEVGQWYWAQVNNTKQYGVFCTLAGNSEDDLTGLAHQSNIPALRTSDDYEIGDSVIVERLPDQSGGDKVTLGMVSDGDGELIVDEPFVSDYEEPEEQELTSEVEGYEVGFSETAQEKIQELSQKIDLLTEQLEERSQNPSEDSEDMLTLHLSPEQMKRLVREGPEDISEQALEVLLN